MTNKFLYKPVKPFSINQLFGEDKTCTDGKGHFITKETAASCPVGMTSLYGSYGIKGHNGLDLMAYHGQEVYCAAEGTVSYAGGDQSAGIGVEVVTKVGNQYFKHIYWHLMGVNVKVGQAVDVGYPLGWADNTGDSSGDHLHFGLKECDSTGKTLNYNNGYKGAVDPLPFLYDGFAIDAAPLLKQYKELLARLIDALSEMLRK
jgi:murein DD-endopeptidase MepM/ murein hydrolase activator NlpD